MMKLKAYSLLIVILSCAQLIAQHSFTGSVLQSDNMPVQGAEVYLESLNMMATTNTSGQFEFENLPSGTINIIVYKLNFDVIEEQLVINSSTQKDFKLLPISSSLSEVVLTQKRERVFALRNLKKIEGTAIYAGKKSEVVILDQLTANKAANTTRQIYSQVVGLNIYENGDAGLQLNIGGRGLDPNRSANFNIRQNNYDISADVLGYPESYYTPPAEALSEIQIVRGAASLQYGTQFGGLINFKMNRPNPEKKVELISRQTMGSFGLKTSFNSLSGTVGKLSYYTYFNYKEGDGWRDNSKFFGRNYFAHVGYQLSDATKIEGELTLFNYLAQQAGGLSDQQFIDNPNFSNRNRNWFDVDWKVYSLRINHRFSNKINGSLHFFGLDAERSAVGFRENRVTQVDDNGARELLVDNFSNRGVEGRLLTKYKLGNTSNVILTGVKYYDASNSQFQGPGTASDTPDFNPATAIFPNYLRQSSFDFPNTNLAFFAENIFNLSNSWTLTPGVRWETIKTQSIGSYKQIQEDLAGNIILNDDIEDNNLFDRNVLLLGVGVTYTAKKNIEAYANFSQNYRSVTFNDIRVVNPAFVIDENISDEQGYTTDFGLRGNYKDVLKFDVNAFGISYNSRLGEVLFEAEDGSVKRKRGNIGDAFIYGLESYAALNVKSLLNIKNEQLRLNLFFNGAFTNSEYLSSEENNVEGKKVEFIPAINIKTGMQFGYKNFTGSLQYTTVAKQFTDATNAPSSLDSQRGIEGEIPAYQILDLSLAYTYKRYKLEAGVNNLLNQSYFTRRATGYPGPGIIPSEPQNFYTTLQIKL